MNILLVSQCHKNALKETRRILDQFAERRGDRTWQTPITQQGLDTLRRMLRRTARKNTAVACHWIRGRDHSELLWVVGDASRFNIQGAVPTNTTQRDVLRGKDENDWHTLQHIYLITSLAALLHDLGKACQAFQDRLHKPSKERNQYRHEWISLRLFQAFVGKDSSDEDWLRRLIDPTIEDNTAWLDRLQHDGLDATVDKPLSSLPPLAQVIGWLIMSHHRLPVIPADTQGHTTSRLGAKINTFQSNQLDDVLNKIGADWNERATANDSATIKPYWTFSQNLPVTTPLWRKRVIKIATRLLESICKSDCDINLNNLYMMHLARLSLMLADHHYSSLTEAGQREKGETGYPLYANTDRKTGQFNQTLDEHLLGVEKHASIIVHALPKFELHLARLVRHKGLRKRSQSERFRWQDRAADTMTALRERAAHQGAFIVNMASTGCGKTLANARIMNALANPQHGLRCAFALGLRTLTLQTGHQFRDLLQLSEHELAIRVGGAPNRELFEHYEQLAEKSGSASVQALFPEDECAGVLYEGNDTHPLLQRAMNDPKVRMMMAAPILVCTVDHLVPATESQRGGRQIAPMLRLMSGDLVLDELDDFDIDDLPALTRLVHWAGLLGTRVLLSSATLPPALVQGMFQAYRAGRQSYQQNRGEHRNAPVNIYCAWFDEFDQLTQDCAETTAFADGHQTFIEKRHTRLARAPVRRRARLAPLDFTASDQAAIRQTFAGEVLSNALALHADHHTVDPHSNKRVSFGLVRMANIDPLFDVALALYQQNIPEDRRIHLCVYHSQFPLLIRSETERRLDQTLDRRNPSVVFDLPDIRQRLDAHTEHDQLFIVLGSPVTEVGRDHDYDWAIVEPSSMRSLIQLAGRVYRHRIKPCDTPNIVVFDTNLRHFEHRGKAAYCKPGFERDREPFRLTDHHLQTLLSEEERTVIDARPRILARPQSAWQPQTSLVDLEHARLHELMLPKQTETRPLTAREIRIGKKPSIPPLNAASAWTLPLAHLTAVLPQQQPFRYDPQPDVELVLLPNEDETDIEPYQVRDSKELVGMKPGDSLYIQAGGQIKWIDAALVHGKRITPWGETDYMAVLAQLAESLELTLEDCAKRYSTVTLPKNTQGWRFHPVLGFTKQR
jgi:CRISPR-associated endonuclease/helicase Cas3